MQGKITKKLTNKSFVKVEKLDSCQLRQQITTNAPISTRI